MDRLLATFKALGDETRLRLVRVLKQGSFNVNELVGILDMGQPRVSRHLRILLDAGLVKARREGSWVYYTLSEKWSGQVPPGAGHVNGAAGFRFLPLLGVELSALQRDGADVDRDAIRACLDERRKNAARFFRGVAGDWDVHRDRVQGPPEHLDRLAEALGRAGTVIDLGTGTGVLLSRLSPRAERLIGIDAAGEMLREARSKVADQGLGNVELRLGTLEHLPVPDAEADAMVANMVLHHAAHPPEALREVHRGLRPGGRFLLADLAAHGEETYRERLGDLWLGFERQDLERWLEETGFEIEDFRELPAAGGRPGVILLSARRR